MPHEGDQVINGGLLLHDLAFLPRTLIAARAPNVCRGRAGQLRPHESIFYALAPPHVGMRQSGLTSTRWNAALARTRSAAGEASCPPILRRLLARNLARGGIEAIYLELTAHPLELGAFAPR
jgi:hypothetical protein